MPGDLLINDKYLVWTDPFGEEFFFHVVDKNTGKEIGTMGKIGLGPGEFVSPIADRFFYDNKVFITDDESTVGRDISKCPKTVFLYDFKSNLLKIVNLGIPVMRIAANRENNILYVIGANPEYIIAKYEL